MRARRRTLLGAAILVACLTLPGAAQASRNCCFELAAENAAVYEIDYHNDGYGYDGAYIWDQQWSVRAIVAFKSRGGGKLKTRRRGYSSVTVNEQSTVTECTSGGTPCFTRKLKDCPGATLVPAGPGTGSVASYRASDSSGYARGGSAGISGGGPLEAQPDDDVYYSVERGRCSLGHGHHGFGLEAAEIGSERGVSLPPPPRGFLAAAGQGDRCAPEDLGSSLLLDDNHVGSDPVAPHQWFSGLSASYALSYFPKRRLDDHFDRLEGLGARPYAFDKWGQHGTRNLC